MGLSEPKVMTATVKVVGHIAYTVDSPPWSPLAAGVVLGEAEKRLTITGAWDLHVTRRKAALRQMQRDLVLLEAALKAAKAGQRAHRKSQDGTSPQSGTPRVKGA